MPAEPAIVDKLAKALENLVTLTIVTSVGANGGKRTMTTRIDLVDGDIVNEIDLEFVTGELKELKPFHEAQVLKGQQIIRDNIEALRAISSFVKDRADAGGT